MTIPSHGIEEPSHRSSRALFWAACALVTMAGFSLFVLSEQTDRFFAWTIDPPLTAAVMGGAYFSSAVLQFGIAREQKWTNAGVILPGIILFTLLTLAATLIHVDRFRLESPIGWIWLTIYLVFPPLGIIVLWRQGPLSAITRASTQPQSIIARNLALTQAAFLTTTGAVLFAYPASASTLWPWVLTPLTSRAVAAWLIGMGVIAGLEYISNDRTLSRLLGEGKAVLVALIAFSLIRFPEHFEWSSGRAWSFLLVLALLAGSAVLAFAPQGISRSPQPPAAHPSSE